MESVPRRENKTRLEKIYASDAWVYGFADMDEEGEQVRQTKRLIAGLTTESWIALDEARSMVESHTRKNVHSDAVVHYYQRRLSTGAKALVQARTAELTQLIEDCEEFGDSFTALEAQNLKAVLLLTPHTISRLTIS